MSKPVATKMPKGTNLDTTVAKPKRTEEKAVRQRQLIEATIDCIAKYGISGTTLAKVTEIAGLSLGLANFHFASKDRLFEETLRFVANEHRDVWQKVNKTKATNDTERYLAIIDSFFHPRICNRKKISIWFAFFGDAGSRGTYLDVVEDIDDERYYESARLIGAIAAENNLTGIDPHAAALTIEISMDGIWLNMVLYPETFPREKSKAMMKHMVAMMLPGCFSAIVPSTK